MQIPTNIGVSLFEEKQEPANTVAPSLVTNIPTSSGAPIYQPVNLYQIPTNIGVSLFNEDQNKPDAPLQSLEGQRPTNAEMNNLFGD